MAQCISYLYLSNFYLSTNKIFSHVPMETSFDFLFISGFAFWKKKLGSFSIIKGSDYRKSNLKVNNSNSLLQVHIEWCSFSQQRCIKHLFYADPPEDINMNKTWSLPLRIPDFRKGDEEIPTNSSNSEWKWNQYYKRSTNKMLMCVA